MLWLIFALTAALSWGIGQVFVKRGLSRTSPLFNNTLATIIDFALWIPIAVMGGVKLDGAAIVFPLALIAGATYFIYFYVIAKGEVSLTGTIQATYPLTTILLSIIFLHEQTNVFQKIAVLLIILGAILIATPNKNGLKNFTLGDWFWWALFGSIIIGFGDFLAKVAINNSNAYTWLFFLVICYIPCCFVNFLIDKKGRVMPALNWQNMMPTIIGVILESIGMIAFYLAFQFGLASLVGPVSSSYVVLTAILAYFFLKEKINKIQLAGIISAASGIILLGIA